MRFRSPRKSSSKSTGRRLFQALPIWTPANTEVAHLIFMSLLAKLGITDVRSYLQKWRIPIAISIVVCAWVGAVNDGFKGFVIGGLLGIVAPIALVWAGVMLTLIALFLAIYVAAWAAIVGYTVAGLDPSARHDFDFLVDGGAGSDDITVSLSRESVGTGHPDVPADGDVENWYNDQQINANVTVNGGAGDDTIYSDNTGFDHESVLPVANPNTGETAYNEGRAAWVFNNVPDSVTGDNTIYDLESQPGTSVQAVNAQLTVTFRGLTSQVTIANSMTAMANVTITDLSINQAIKDAINNDAVLSKLLVAEDAAGNTLVVRSLIDGSHNETDLAITFQSPALTAGQTGTLFSVATGLADLTDGYDVSDFADSGADNRLNGQDSITTSDNTITGGEGNDVIVLSTNLQEVQMYATQWMWKYNHDRPHMALGGITPKQRLAMAA